MRGTVREIVMAAAAKMQDIQELERGIKALQGRSGYDIEHARKDPRLSVQLLIKEYDRVVRDHDRFMEAEVEVYGYEKEAVSSEEGLI